MSALIIYLQFVMPGIAVFGLISAIIVGLNRKLPEAKRLTYYDWTAINLPIMIGVSGAGQALMLYKWLSHRTSAGILLTGSAREHAPLYGALGCAVALFVIPLLALGIRKRIFAWTDEEVDMQDLPMLLARVKKHAQLAGLISAACLIYIVAAKPLHFSISQGLAHGGISAVILPICLRYMMTRPSKPNGPLTDRAKALAPMLNVEVREVRTITGSDSKKHLNAFAHIYKGIILITQKAIEVLTPQQMDWLLAHELAHFRDKRIYQRDLRLVNYVWLTNSLIIVASCGFADSVSSIWYVWVIGILPVTTLALMCGMSLVRRRLEYEADIQALGVVRDLEVATSALKALANHSGNPKSANQELDEHPKLIKRIKAMRTAAVEMGISIGQEELLQPSPHTP